MEELPAQEKESEPQGQKLEKFGPLQVVREGKIKGAAAKEYEKGDLVEE
ncbi:hypothetical protein [Salinimicrobium sediminilitoris]|nr:hypothetical protein [Salinimicrobium sediminilitoris]MCC8361147.1 hypothetical protein [Salinimicrobium sediminilitoris]